MSGLSLFSAQSKNLFGLPRGLHVGLNRQGMYTSTGIPGTGARQTGHTKITDCPVPCRAWGSGVRLLQPSAKIVPSKLTITERFFPQTIACIELVILSPRA